MRRSRLFFAPRGRTVSERFVRGLLLAGVFALCVVAYEHYFRSVAEDLAARGTVVDRLGVLRDSDRAWLLGQAAILRGRFGLELAVHVGGPRRAPRPDDPRAIFVYFDPECRHGMVSVPPLTALALPKGFVEDLGREHLDAACREHRARQGVLATVGLLTATLGEAASRGQGDGS